MFREMNDAVLPIEDRRKLSGEETLSRVCLASKNIERGAKRFFGHRKRSRETAIVIDVYQAHRAALTRKSACHVYRGRGFSHPTLLVPERDEPSERQSSHNQNL
jgi:hypothetical protein